ncbi:MAG: hypothetical protein JWP58_1320 [Hymenobacter sp.]|nr:hypothetical protein [Hymenobacter sp.]
MQRFFLFLLALAALLFGVDFILARTFDAMYTRTLLGQSGGEINQYLALKPTPEALVIGNSRARYQIDPDSFAVPMYNLCHAGMGQSFQTGLLQVLELEHKLPKAVLLHVDLGEYVAEESLADMGTLRYYYNKLPFVTEEINNISRYERGKYFFRFYRYNGRVISQLKNYLQSRRNLPVTNGYQPLEPFATDTVNALLAVDGGRDAKPPRFQYAHLRHLLKFIDICKKNNVKLLCFTSPYYQAHNYGPVVVAPLDSLLRAQGIPYLNTNAQPLPLLWSHRLFWHDNDHLNRLGAPYLSQQVARWSKPYLTAIEPSRID